MIVQTMSDVDSIALQEAASMRLTQNPRKFVGAVARTGSCSIRATCMSTRLVPWVHCGISAMGMVDRVRQR